MIKHIKLNQENLKHAIKVQNEIFPELNGRMNYIEAVNGANDFEYFLIYSGDECVGISGLYHLGADPENCWLGWFGILPELRRKNYGSEAIRLLEETARDLGYRYMRVIIDKNKIDQGSISFLKANGYVGEPYDNPRDKVSQSTDMMIMTRTFYQERIPEWGNKNIHLTDSIEAMKNFKA